MNKYPEIHTPRGSIVVGEDAKAILTWNEGAFKKQTGKFIEAQIYIDNEVYYRCEPFTPMKTGMLIKSGELGTDFGQGFVKWIAPYAAYQYYMPNKIGAETGSLRGPFWFERMKEVHGANIIKNAAKLMG